MIIAALSLYITLCTHIRAKEPVLIWECHIYIYIYIYISYTYKRRCLYVCLSVSLYVCLSVCLYHHSGQTSRGISLKLGTMIGFDPT